MFRMVYSETEYIFGRLFRVEVESELSLEWLLIRIRLSFDAYKWKNIQNEWEKNDDHSNLL